MSLGVFIARLMNEFSEEATSACCMLSTSLLQSLVCLSNCAVYGLCSLAIFFCLLNGGTCESTTAALPQVLIPQFFTTPQCFSP